jgi:hypothetical protein
MILLPIIMEIISEVITVIAARKEMYENIPAPGISNWFKYSNK